MTEMLDVNGLSNPIDAKTALGLLRQVNRSFSETPDHLVLEHMWLILKNCQLPTTPELQTHTPNTPVYENICYILEHIVNGGAGLLRSIYLRIEDKGLTSQGFQGHMKAQLNEIVGVLKIMNKFLEKSGMDAKYTWFSKEILKGVTLLLNAHFSKEYPYQTQPKMMAGSNRLWSKVKKMTLKEITELSDVTECIICFGKLEDFEFAILDSCPHIVCLPCAHRLFNLPNTSNRKCPMCRATVKSYTSSHDAARYRASSSFVNSARKTFKSMKSLFNATDSTDTNTE